MKSSSALVLPILPRFFADTSVIAWIQKHSPKQI